MIKTICNMKFKGTKVFDVEYYTTMDLFYKYMVSNVQETDEEAKANALLISKAPEMYKELKETIIDLKILRNQVLNALKTNHLFEGMPELIDLWIERKEQLIKEATEI